MASWRRPRSNATGAAARWQAAGERLRPIRARRDVIAAGVAAIGPMDDVRQRHRRALAAPARRVDRGCRRSTPQRRRRRARGRAASRDRGHRAAQPAGERDRRAAPRSSRRRRRGGRRFGIAAAACAAVGAASSPRGFATRTLATAALVAGVIGVLAVAALRLAGLETGLRRVASCAPQRTRSRWTPESIRRSSHGCRTGCPCCERSTRHSTTPKRRTAGAAPRPRRSRSRSHRCSSVPLRSRLEAGIVDAPRAAATQRTDAVIASAQRSARPRRCDRRSGPPPRRTARRGRRPRRRGVGVRTVARGRGPRRARGGQPRDPAAHDPQGRRHQHR